MECQVKVMQHSGLRYFPFLKPFILIYIFHKSSYSNAAVYGTQLLLLQSTSFLNYLMK